jgi:hypothetical protein
VPVQEPAGLGDGAGDPASADSQQFGEQVLRKRTAQVKHGGKDAVGRGDLGMRAGSGGAATFGTAS